MLVENGVHCLLNIVYFSTSDLEESALDLSAVSALTRRQMYTGNSIPSTGCSAQNPVVPPVYLSALARSLSIAYPAPSLSNI